MSEPERNLWPALAGVLAVACCSALPLLWWQERGFLWWRHAPPVRPGYRDIRADELIEAGPSAWDNR